MDHATESLEWCGPDGHVHPVYGVLRRGRTYAVPSEDAAYFLTLTDFWKQTAARAPKSKAVKE